MSIANIVRDLQSKPIKLARVLWPHVTFYREQRRIIESVWEAIETVSPAGNKLGKDFVAGFIALGFFITRYPCRIITTSAKADHLRVLWGEIGRYIQQCKYPLTSDKGGPLYINHQDIRRMLGNGERCPLSYLHALVASQDTIAAMQGHHIAKTGDGVPRTLFMCDEASSVPHDYYRMARTWANRIFIFGNPWPCDNFFKHAVEGDPEKPDDKGGDRWSPDKSQCYRRIIRIKATDSPNVRLALAEIAAGKKPSGRMLVPGVKDYEDYVRERSEWDKVQLCVSHDATFYKGAENLLFPPEWLNLAEERADQIRRLKRVARSIGIDTAEGGDDTSMSAVDEHGLIEQVSKKTPDTNVIIGEAIAFGRKHGVSPDRWVFDRGGGGKEHADRLRAKGYPVRTVAFGESVTLDLKHGRRQLSQRKENQEERYAYKNRRAQMYGEASLLFNPADGPVFALPKEYFELRRQLAPIPKLYDDEGRLYMLPKRKKDPDSKELCLIDIIGCSPDEADSLVLAIYGMQHKMRHVTAGAV